LLCIIKINQSINFYKIDAYNLQMKRTCAYLNLVTPIMVAFDELKHFGFGFGLSQGEEFYYYIRFGDSQYIIIIDLVCEHCTSVHFLGIYCIGYIHTYGPTSLSRVYIQYIQLYMILFSNK